MKIVDLERFLSGEGKPIQQLAWLEKNFLQEVILQLNDIESRKRLALYGGDRIPENERNLTDSRNRVSLIIEYEFARIITKILSENGVNDWFCSYVVANRFPDLEIRNSQGKTGLRFEVKCLQSTAEEKSANFSTLRKDIRPDTDFVVVFLWEWFYDPNEIQWDRSPYILDVYVFNASSLAKLRDWYWLNNPPKNLGGGFQGFDIRYAVNCVGGQFNEEEGNFGKLLRLWNKNFQYRPIVDSLLLQTETDYENFKRSVVNIGFKSLASQILPRLTGNPSISRFEVGTYRAGYKSDDMGFIQAFPLIRSKLVSVMIEHNLKLVWIFRDKYQWRHYSLSSSRIEFIKSGKKPKTIIASHFEG